MSSTITKTIDDVIYEARLAVNDSQVPYRNADSVFVQYLNSALREVYRYRADAFIGNFNTGILSNNAVVTYTIADLGLNPATPFPIDDRLFFAPVVFYVTGRIEMSDDEFVDNTRSAQLLGAFRTMLVGVGN